jgi:hypothetical protein
VWGLGLCLLRLRLEHAHISAVHTEAHFGHLTETPGINHYKAGGRRLGDFRIHETWVQIRLTFVPRSPETQVPSTHCTEMAPLGAASTRPSTNEGLTRGYVQLLVLLFHCFIFFQRFLNL